MYCTRMVYSTAQYSTVLCMYCLYTYGALHVLRILQVSATTKEGGNQVCERAATRIVYMDAPYIYRGVQVRYIASSHTYAPPVRIHTVYMFYTVYVSPRHVTLYICDTVHV
jgi:hypothetical protein